MADKRDELDKLDRAHQFLGDITPAPSARDHVNGRDGSEDEVDESASGDDADKHAGTRDVDEGGGVATEVGGSRNYHHGGGAAGGDLGNRPE
jgi:hypothetical protein